MNISPLTVDELRTLGWDIVRVSEVMDPMSKDVDILYYAHQNERVVVTQDLDFSMLLALSGAAKPSLINLRMEDGRPDAAARRLAAIVPGMAAELASGAVLSVDDKYIRYRTLPISSD